MTGDSLGRWERRLFTAWLLALVVWGMTDVRRRARIEPSKPEAHKTDLTIFTTAGAAFFTDADPYTVTNPRGWKYCYPPLFALTVAPLDAWEPKTQAMVWFLLSCGLAALAWREVVLISAECGYDVRLRRANQTSGRRLAWLAVAIVALPTLNCLQRGQVGILNIWLLLWGYRLLSEGRSIRRAVLGGMILCLPAVIKLTPALPVLVAIATHAIVDWRRGERRRAAAGGVGLAAGCGLFVWGIPALLVGWQANLNHLQNWSRSIASMAVEVDPGSSIETPYTVRNQSLSNAAYRLGNWIDHAWFDGPDDRAIDAVPFNPQHPALLMDSVAAERMILAARLLMLGLLGLACLRTVWQASPIGLAAVFGLAGVASLAVSPISRGHYFISLLPAAIWVPFWWAEFRSSAGALWLSRTLLAASALHYVGLDIAGRAGLLGLTSTAWLAVGAIAMTLTRLPAARRAAEPENAITHSSSRLAA